MGWSSMTYRYEQYKNALEYIRQHGNGYDEPLNLKAKINPREDYNLGRTLIEALRELVRKYEQVAVLEPEDEGKDEWYICSNCGARLAPLYWEDAPEDFNYCPSCGCHFEGEHILEEMNIHIKRCEDCGHCAIDGYEYPESYCELGIEDNDPRYDGEGCSYTAEERKNLCKKQKEYDVSLWWDESKNKEDLT